MTSQDQDELPETLAAAMWFARLENEGPACYVPFDEWITTSATNVRAFLAVSEMAARLNGLDPYRQIDVKKLIARANDRVVPFTSAACQAAAPNATDETVASKPVRRRFRHYLKPAVALVAAVVAFMGIWVASEPTRSAQTYGTGLGEQRSIKLADGSLVHLNTNSRVKVRYTPEKRYVALLNGEALFSVEHDASRPFQVSTGLALIQAVGTQFDVYRQAVRTTISVVAGEVRILLPSDVLTTAPATGSSPNSPRGTPLLAGEQASIEPDGRLLKHAKPDVAEAVQWRQRRLKFDNMALADVATEFNRYNTIKISVEGEDLRARPVSGIYSADHPQALFIYLKSTDPRIAIAEAGDTVVIRPR